MFLARQMFIFPRGKTHPSGLPTRLANSTYFFFAILRNVFANATRFLVVLDGFLPGDLINSESDFPDFLAWAVKAPGFFTAPAIQFFLSAIILSLY